MSGPTNDDPGEIAVGVDGAAMLALSLAVMLLTGGISLGLALRHVWRVAQDARADSEEAPGAILVLGQSLDRAARPSPQFRARLERGRVLAARWPERPVVVLGGRTGEAMLTEAAAGRAYLTQRGVAPGRIILEDRSRHTLENLVHYRARFAWIGAAPVLVTSRFHLARSTLIAAGLGIAHAPCAAEDRWTPSLGLAGTLLWEALLIQWYLTGRWFARYTGNRRMAARIG